MVTVVTSPNPCTGLFVVYSETHLDTIPTCLSPQVGLEPLIFLGAGIMGMCHLTKLTTYVLKSIFKKHDAGQGIAGCPSQMLDTAGLPVRLALQTGFPAACS